MWKDYLTLSRTEQRATLLLLIVLFIAIVLLISTTVFTSNAIDYKIVKGINSMDGNKSDLSKPTEVAALAPFNPNDVSIKELEALGFNTRAIINWKKYIEAGGRFKSTNELYNIYGIDSAQLSRIVHLAVFDNSRLPLKTNFGKPSKYTKRIYVDLNKLTRPELLTHFPNALVDSIESYQQTRYFTRHFCVDELTNCHVDSAMLLMAYASSPKRMPSKAPQIILEINTADTTELDLLKGVGPAYARRIVYYRQKLGGYCRIDQLLEVEGVSMDLLNNIKPMLKVDAALVKPLNVNKASLRQLKEHPYLGFYKARDIIERRKANGDIKSLSEVFALPAFKDANIDLLSVYLATR